MAPTSRSTPPLTPKMQRFIHEYLIDLNATQAAIRAGYSPKGASTQGERLLRNVEIAAAVRAGQAEQLAAIDITSERVKLELARIAFADPRRFFDAQGKLKPVGELSVGDAAAIAQLEVVMANLDAGDGKRDEVHRLKWVDKVRALEILAKHFKMFDDSSEVENFVSLVERLNRARVRVKK